MHVRRAWDAKPRLQQIDKEGLRFVYERIEKPIVGATAAMIQNGLLIDMGRLEQVVKQISRKRDRLQKQIDQNVGRRVNVASPSSLAAALYDQLRLPVLSRNRDDSPSTSTATLMRLRQLQPIVGQIIELRSTQASLQQATFLQLRVHADTGRVHGQLDPLGTATGRFTCASPNLLGISKELKELVIASPGCQLLEFDASQIELRVLAHFSQSPELLKAFHSGVDLHRITASRLFGCSAERVSHTQRHIGKQVNYAIAYGQHAAGLAAQIGVTTTEAQGYIDEFFRTFSGTSSWIDRTQSDALSSGNVRTLYGRRRVLPDVKSKDRQKLRQVMRQAVNTVIQGTAADIHKLMIVRLFGALPSDCRLLLAVHDSILVEVPDERHEEIAGQVQDIFEQLPPNFSVPIKHGMGRGGNWGECAPIRRA